MPTDPPFRDARGLPLAAWAERTLASFARRSGAPALLGMSGAALLFARARSGDFRIPGRVSAGGGCRLHPAAHGGWVALNLARPDDRDLLPALFEDVTLDPGDDDAIAARIAMANATALVRRGREMGLALASLDEKPFGEQCALITPARGQPAPDRPPRVVDLSALWAGPLASHLLSCAGAHVTKVESISRPDAMRHGDPALFADLNDGKDHVAVDLRTSTGRDTLSRMIADADIVIEAARPRALRQLGLDPADFVRVRPALSWITITAHGIAGDAANWVGFGDDTAVTAGLSAALREETGVIGFVGDAIADPLTGIAAAITAWKRWTMGEAGHLILSMSGTVRSILAAERRFAPHALAVSLRAWAASVGQPFPC